MIYHCPWCAFKISVPDEQEGQQRPCPSCLRPTTIPEVRHRDRLEALFLLQGERKLTSGEWTEVATHYLALGDRESALKAERSASRVFAREAERHAEETVPDLLTPVEAEEVARTLAAEGGREGQRRAWWQAGVAALVWLVAGLAWRPLLALACAQLAGGFVAAVAAAIAGGGLAQPLARSLWWPPGGAQGHGERLARRLGLTAAGAWVVGLALFLYAVSTRG